MIYRATISHIDSITELYNYSINNDFYANCNTTNLSNEYWLNKLTDQSCIILVDVEEDLRGFVVLQKNSIRSEYNNVFELSMYIDPQHRGRTIAAKLYKAIMRELEKRNCIIVALVFSDNTSSLKMLEAAKFTEIIALPKAALKSGGLYDMKILAIKLN